MPVRNAQRVLEDAVHAALDAIAPEDIEVTFTLSPVTSVYAERGEADDDSTQLFSEIKWYLSLHMSREVRPGKRAVMVLSGNVPFHMCGDGDLVPMLGLVDKMWADQEFGWLMADDDLDKRLDRVAQEAGGD